MTIDTDNLNKRENKENEYTVLTATYHSDSEITFKDRNELMLALELIRSEKCFLIDCDSETHFANGPGMLSRTYDGRLTLTADLDDEDEEVEE